MFTACAKIYSATPIYAARIKQNIKAQLQVPHYGVWNDNSTQIVPMKYLELRLVNVDFGTVTSINPVQKLNWRYLPILTLTYGLSGSDIFD